MSEKLLILKELRIELVGVGCPFRTPPSASTIRGWRKQGLKVHVLPCGKRKHYKLSEVLAFLRKHGEIG